MLRVTLLCVSAVLATVSVPAVVAVDVTAVVPSLPYVQNLRRVNQANDRVRSKLVDSKPSVVSSDFHYALVLGVVDAAANRELKSSSNDSQRVYVESLNSDLPLVYIDPAAGNSQLKKDLDEIQAALQPLVDLIQQVCQDLDDKDCNAVVQLQLEKKDSTWAALERGKAVEVLKASYKLARAYLKLNEDLETASQQLSGLGYSLTNLYNLSNLSKLLSKALWTARLLLK